MQRTGPDGLYHSKQGPGKGAWCLDAVPRTATSWNLVGRAKPRGPDRSLATGQLSIKYDHAVSFLDLRENAARTGRYWPVSHDGGWVAESDSKSNPINF